MDFNEIFRTKTKNLALDVIRVFSPIPFSDTVSVIRKQIIRSSTSVAANYRAVGRARSEKERFAKLCIVVKEADETLFWLEMVESLKLISLEDIISLKNSAEEIVKVTSAYKKKLSNK
jgi:four helix bundle protein